MARPFAAIPRNERLYRPEPGGGFGLHRYQTDGVLLIQSGFAVCYGQEENGTPVCYRFIKPGDLMGGWYLFGNQAHPFGTESYFQVIQPLSGCVLPPNELEQAFCASPDLARAIQECTARDVLNMASHFTKMTTYDSVQKVRYLWQTFGENGVNLNELTHETIAQILNLNRVTVTKALKTVLFEGTGR